MFFCFIRIENLKQFVDDLENDRLEPYLKSEPVPADNNGPVTVAVAKNFDDVVTNNGKDTLIEFYAPWYAHKWTLYTSSTFLADRFSFGFLLFIRKLGAAIARAWHQSLKS